MTTSSRQHLVIKYSYSYPLFNESTGNNKSGAIYETDKKNLLNTGPPGAGKTILIKQLAFQLQNLNPIGFCTIGIRNGVKNRIDTELFKLNSTEEQIVLSSTIIQKIYRIISK